MKLHFPKLKVFVPKKVLLIALGTLVVLALLSFGIVRQVQYSRAKAVSDHKAFVARQNYENRLKAEAVQNGVLLTKASAKGNGACDYIVKLSVAPATKRLVAVPDVCKL